MQHLRAVPAREHEIPGAHVRARFNEQAWNTTSDEEGYFVLNINPDQALAPGWHEVIPELVDSVGEPAERVTREKVRSARRGVFPRSQRPGTTPG